VVVPVLKTIAPFPDLTNPGVREICFDVEGKALGLTSPLVRDYLITTPHSTHRMVGVARRKKVRYMDGSKVLRIHILFTSFVRVVSEQSALAEDATND